MSRFTGRVIKGKFTKERLNRILGLPSWKWEELEEDEHKCGLEGGKIDSAGWGNDSACARIWLHLDGICFAGGMDIPEDIAYARKLYNKVREVLMKR